MNAETCFDSLFLSELVINFGKRSKRVVFKETKLILKCQLTNWKCRTTDYQKSFKSHGKKESNNLESNRETSVAVHTKYNVLVKNTIVLLQKCSFNATCFDYFWNIYVPLRYRLKVNIVQNAFWNPELIQYVALSRVHMSLDFNKHKIQ